MDEINEVGLREYLDSTIRGRRKRSNEEGSSKGRALQGILKEDTEGLYIKKEGRGNFRIKEGDSIFIPKSKQMYVVKFQGKKLLEKGKIIELRERRILERTYDPVSEFLEDKIDQGQGLLFAPITKSFLEYLEELEPDYDNDSKNVLYEKLVVAINNIVIEQGPQFKMLLMDEIKNTNYDFIYITNYATGPLFKTSMNLSQKLRPYGIESIQLMELLKILGKNELMPKLGLEQRFQEHGLKIEYGFKFNPVIGSRSHIYYREGCIEEVFGMIRDMSKIITLKAFFNINPKK